MQKLPTIAVVGCGAIAESYHLPALVRIRGMRERLVLVDARRERAEQLASQFQISTVSADVDSIVKSVNGVIIATPPAYHSDIAGIFLGRGIPVLCEKPLTETIEEAEELVRLADCHQTTLMVNQTRRLFPTYQMIRLLLAAGDLGPLQTMTYVDGCEFSWPAASPFHFAPGAKGVLSDTGIHLLDTICWWLGEQPEFGRCQVDSHGGPEAVASVTLQAGSCTIEIMVSRLHRLDNGFRIVGQRGSIVAGVEDWREITVRYADGRKRRYRARGAPRQYADFAGPLIRNFINVIRGKAQPLVDGASVLPAIRLLQQSYERAEPFAAPWDRHWEQRYSEQQPREQQPQEDMHVVL